MRNIITPLLLLSAALTFSSFATTWQIRDTEYTVDTLQHVKIGPGTTATQLKLNGAKKFRVFYTTTNLDNSKVDVRTVKANNKYASCATVPAMAQAATTASGETYFAGVNADFFGNSAPIGYAVVDGDVYRSPMSAGWASFGFGTERKPVIGASVAISATATINGTVTTINGINVTRGENNLILYSPQNESSNTGTNEYGTEVLVEPVDGKMGILGRTTKMKVVGAPVSNEGKMNIPANGYVLSGHGTAATLLNGLTEGTEIEIKAWASYDGVDVMDITQMTGGQPVILKDGVVLDTEGAIDHLVANNPRTAVGYNNKNELVMLVVDGRSAISDGCVSKELADIMKNVGCSDALNFDGGGSSTMYCGPKLGIINNPSDGNPRSVTNGLFLVATGDETNNEIAAIEFKDADSRRTVNLPQYGIYTPEFYGFNSDEILVDTKVEGVTLTLEGDNAAYGEVTNDGKSLYITAAEGNFALTANYNGIKKSVPVAIKPGEISFRLPKVLISNRKGYTVEAISTNLAGSMPLDNRAFTWTTNDDAIATIDNKGFVKGVANGTTTVSGEVDSKAYTLEVVVENPESDVMPVYREFGTAEDWTFRQVGGTDLTVSQLGDGFKLNYIGNGSSRGAYISVDRRVDVWSLPEGLRISVNPGEVSMKKVSVTAMNALGELASAWAFTETELPKNQVSTFNLSFKDIWDINDIAIYPITITTLRFDLGTSAKGTAYEIQVPTYAAVYTDPSGVENIEGNNTIKLYPNPVAAGVPVQLSTTADVEVYNLNGALVSSQTAVDAIATEGLAAGIYVVKVNAEGNIRTAKLIIR